MTMNDCDSLLVTLTGQWTVVKLLTSQLTSIVAASLVWREEGGVCTVSVVGRGGEVKVYTHSSVFNKLKREEILTARYLLRLWKSKIFNSSVHTQVKEVKNF